MKVATIGGQTDSVLLQQNSKVAVDSRGLIYATVINWSRVAVYDPSGRLVHQIGEPGQGPGEFTRAELLSIGAGDTLYVVDNRRARISVFAPDHKFVRTILLAGDAQIRALIPMPDGRMVYSRNDASPERVGLPLHTVGTDGQPRKSFGIESPVVDANDLSRIAYRLLSRAPDDSSVWVSHFGEYKPEHWTLGGRKLASLFRDLKPMLVRQGRADSTTGMLPFAVAGIEADTAGLLWAVISVPMKDPPALIRPDTSNGKRGAVPVVQPRRSDSLVEVIDLTTGHLLVSEIAEPLFAGSAMAGLFYARHIDEVGIVSFEIWQAQLVRK